MSILTIHTFFTAQVSGVERVVAVFPAGVADPVSPRWPGESTRKYTNATTVAAITETPPEGSTLIETIDGGLVPALAATE